MMLSPKTHRTYKVIVTRRPEMHHCSYNLRCSFQDKRVHLVTIRQRWHAVNLPWTNESSWKGRDRNEPSEVSTMCWSCALCFRKGSLKKSGADVFAWNKWCWRLLYTLYKLLCIHKYVCTPQNTHTQVDFCALSAHKKSLAEIVAIKKSVGRLLKGMNLPSTSTQIATDLSDSCACVPLATLSTEEDVDNVRLSPRQCWTRKTWLTYFFWAKFNMCDFPPGPDRHQFNNPGVYLSQNIFRKAARCEVTWPETVVMVPTHFNSNRPTTQT